MRKDEEFHRELERMKISKQKTDKSTKPSETETPSTSLRSTQSGHSTHSKTGSSNGHAEKSSSESPPSGPRLSNANASARFHGAHLIFEGMMVGKKFKHEIMNHSRFCWIDSETGRLHWSKHKGDKVTSKSIDLKRDVTAVNVTHRTHVVFTHVLGSKNTVVLEATDEPSARLWLNVANCMRETHNEAISGNKEEDEIVATINGKKGGIDTSEDDEEAEIFRIS